MDLRDPSLLRQAARIGQFWIEAADGPAIDVINPATGALVGRVPRLGAEATRDAIEAARIAQRGWAARTARERSAILRRWFELMMANQDDLALILTLEQG